MPRPLYHIAMVGDSDSAILDGCMGCGYNPGQRFVDYE
jgi:hypothetical protein